MTGVSTPSPRAPHFHSLPLFSHLSLCCPLCPSFAFSLFCWKDREIVHSDLHTHTRVRTHYLMYADALR